MNKRGTLVFGTLQDAMDCARVLVKPTPVPSKPRASEIRTQVVGGTVKWTPVNKTAALVVSKAPWWAKPPTPPAQFRPKIIKCMKITPTNNPMLDGKYEDKSDTEMNIELAHQMSKHGIKDVEAAESLVERAKEATAALDYIANHYKKSWIEVSDLLASAIGEIRGKRFAVEAETKQMLSALGDIRKFFFDEKHEVEVQRLLQFVDLCERLQKLKECGFLDAIADTILTLSVASDNQTDAVL